MFIRTPRLFLRPAWVEDARALHAAIACWDVVKNLGRAPWPYTMADAERFAAGEALEPGEISFLIFARTGGDPLLVGSIGLGLPNGSDRASELGYWIAPDHWDCGYATEAGRAMLRLAFDGLRLPALSAVHFADNPASGAVLRKLGFEPTGAPTPCFSRARAAEAAAIEYRLVRDAWTGRPLLAMAA